MEYLTLNLYGKTTRDILNFIVLKVVWVSAALRTANAMHLS